MINQSHAITILQQLASADRVEAGNANPLYGGVLRCPKPRATQDKRSEQEHFVFNVGVIIISVEGDYYLY